MCLLAAPRARRFSSGGEEDGYDRGMHKVSDVPACSLAQESWQQAAPEAVGFREEASPALPPKKGPPLSLLSSAISHPLVTPTWCLKEGAHPLAEAPHLIPSDGGADGQC